MKMVKFQPFLKGTQRFVNAVGPYVLGNIIAAGSLNSGIEHIENYTETDLPSWLEKTGFYFGLGTFNLGIFLPIMKEGGLANYVRKVFDRPEKMTFILSPHGKSIALVGTFSFMLFHDTIREANTAALDAIIGDVSSLYHVDEKVITPPEPSKKAEPPKVESVSGVDLGNAEIENKITAYVNGLRVLGLARARGIEDYSIFAKDLHDGSIIVDINTHVQRLAASTNKVYVLLAAEALVYEGKLAYTDQLERNLEAMIARSNNFSTDWVIDQCGGEDAVNKIVRSYGFADTIIEKIRQRETGGRTLGNKTSAHDLGTFFEQLYQGKLPRSVEMRKIFTVHSLGHPDRIADRTCIPENARYLQTNGGYIEQVEDKTGFLWGANTDAGLVTAHFLKQATNETVTVPYILSFLVEDENAKPDGFRGTAEQWGRAKSETLRSISEEIFWDGFHVRYSDIPPSCNTHNGRHPQ